MPTATTLFYFALLGLSSVQSAPSLETRAAPACVKKYYGTFITTEFTDKSGETVFMPYYFNNKQEIAYDAKNPTGHPKIKAEFQRCTPNYAGGSNKDDGENVLFYGRFYVPTLKKCIGVTNPTASPPYFLGALACPTAAEMATKKSIPFNFIDYEDAGIVDMRWIGGTIKSKKIYQGPDPPARYCGGEYYANATNLEYGYKYPYLGQPNTDKSDDYRVHLYCNHKNPPNGTNGSGYQLFLVPVNSNSDPFP